ncbi:ATPase family AAA domain-containing protein 1-A-like [Thalassophryne amazonica]|uniref:ATPase family AAA domain-containing protein 1-A-like n=1 Tax=Thalassophryne amazonica TaxID=390379 RepID=UPI001470D1AD|nr:ATPase family AAA domain-containing protein 1-A-like [Thalassophryne amazonica]XP_034047087.1 ATPase family AAA domain-containing protein 1-A-like [Thalassophryne amazonica]
MSIAAHLIDPKSMTESWADIAGLDDIIEELQDNVILPIQQRYLLLRSKLFVPPKGVLLCGPPGCGKTMIAKVAAKASGCHFINLQASALTDKWYSESQKLTAAVFSLAAKIQPCIIFIDEIDSFLRNQSSQDGEAIAMMKAQFLSLWDGLQGSGQVMVIGATNRPYDIDPAILRRMPTAFHVGLPNTGQRQQILRLMLAGQNVSSSINLKEIAEQTEGISGSDLKEICRNAVIHQVHEHVKRKKKRQSSEQQTDSQGGGSAAEEQRVQPVTQMDLLFGLTKLKESKRATSCAVPNTTRP